MLLLQTERLFINSPALEDIDDWHALHSDPDVMQYIDGARQRRTIRQWLKQDIAHQNKYGFSMGSVFRKESHQFIGRAGIFYRNYEDNQPDIEIGYVLHKTYWGQGYATELVQNIIKWGFVNLNFTKLMAITHPENRASQCVLEKSGMKFSRRVQYQGSDCDFYEITEEKYE